MAIGSSSLWIFSCTGLPMCSSAYACWLNRSIPQKKRNLMCWLCNCQALISFDVCTIASQSLSWAVMLSVEACAPVLHKPAREMGGREEKPDWMCATTENNCRIVASNKTGRQAVQIGVKNKLMKQWQDGTRGIFSSLGWYCVNSSKEGCNSLWKQQL